MRRNCPFGLPLSRPKHYMPFDRLSKNSSEVYSESKACETRILRCGNRNGRQFAAQFGSLTFKPARVSFAKLCLVMLLRSLNIVLAAREHHIQVAGQLMGGRRDGLA